MRICYESDYQEYQRDRSGNSINSLRHASSMPHEVRNNPREISLMANSKKIDLFHLRKLITKHKVKILSNNFIGKLRQNNTHRKPPDDGFLETKDQLNLYNNLLTKLENTEGLILGNIALTVWSFVNIIQIAIMVFIFSINIVFKETQDNKLFLQFRIFSVALYVFDMILNFTTQRFQNGRRLINLREIGQFYIGSGFFIDFVSIAMFPIYLIVDSEVTIFISLVALVKLWSSIKKFQKFEYLYIKTSEKEHYYGLIKVFLTNFVIGHFLSVALNLMATSNYDHKNWHSVMKISDESWYIKYIWGYYWGTNIMLTVGFGDLVASTYVEALCLILIETFSCITLAYNISTVGSLMSELKSKDEIKKKQLKIFHRMSEANEISNELTTRISNFIEESFQIRQTFEFEEEDSVIDSLPKGIQSEYRIQANKILFDNIGFLNNMSSKTLVNLAENIERKISHPQEIIKKKGTLGNFTIISNGSIGLCCRRRYSTLNGQTIEKLTVQKGAKPKLISMDFIKGKSYDFDIKSLGYSIVYFLERSNFMECLKDFELDYQFFCTMRDRDEYLFGENQLYPCSVCKTQYHNKFHCHRLHFVPIHQHVIRKGNMKQKTCKRYNIERCDKDVSVALKERRSYKADYERFLKYHFGKMYVEKVIMSRQLFEKAKRQKQMQNGSSRRIGILNKKKEKEKTEEESMSFFETTNHIYFPDTNQEGYEKIEKLLLRDQNEYKDFWDLEVDHVHNFKYYFTSFNADNVGESGKKKMETSCRLIN